MSSAKSTGSLPKLVSQTLHANFLVIDKLGVLITGKPGIGKSELTLALLDRGHQLVCDDVVDIKLNDHQLIGSCPSVSRGYLLITGIGIIDVPKLFGLGAVVNQHPIDLMISLVSPKNKLRIENPLDAVYQEEKIAGIKLPNILFPVHTESHLPLLIETLVRHHRLKLAGDDPRASFDNRLQKERDLHDPEKNKNRQ